MTTVTPFLVVLALGALGCSSERQSTAGTDNEVRGRQLIERMSARLARARTVSVNTSEMRNRSGTDGDTARMMVTRQVTVRQPDRLHFKASGGLDLEGWYDGKRLTLASHRDRVFAQTSMPPTIDSMLDALADWYGVPLPLGDLLYSSPAHALLAPTTQGGYVGPTRVQGVSADHLAFKDRGVDWEMTASMAAPLLMVLLANAADAQTVRSTWHTTTTCEVDGAVATGARTTTVRGNEGYAAVGSRGANVVTDHGAAAVREHGTVVATEDGYVAAGCRSAAAIGRGGAVGARQCGSVTVGNRYDDYDAWRAVAGAAAVIAGGPHAPRQLHCGPCRRRCL